MYDELIKRLREFASIPEHCENVESCDGCSKEEICLSFTNKRIIEVATQAADAIEKLSKPKWISVEDALPEEDAEVLISYRYKEGEGDTSHVDIDITTYGQMYFGGREVAGVKHWRPPFEYFSSNYEVIAWMPLPKPYEPPKEE